MCAKKTSRTVKKPEVRRQEIVAAATELFMSQGYEKTSTNDVMKALDIAKGTIYHYFESKEKILDAVVDHLADGYVQRRQEELDACAGNALDKIRILFPGDDGEKREEDSVEHLHSLDNVRLHARLIAVLVERLAPVFGGLIRQGCAEGLFTAEHPDEIAELLLAGVQFLTDRGMYPWDDAVVARRTGALPSIIESMLEAEPGSFGWLSGSSPEAEGESQ